MLRGWAWEECLVKGLRCHEVVGGVLDHVFGGGVHVGVYWELRLVIALITGL